MKKKSSVFIYTLIIGLLVLSTSCKKDGIPVLTTNAVSEISQTTAKSGGNVTSDGGLAITYRGVCWSTTTNPTIADNKTIDSEGIGSFTSKLSGLTAGTTYYVRAYARSSNGTGYGDVVTFKTSGEGGTTGTFTDPRDGNVYKTITIGGQIWMAENLKYLPSVVGSTTGSETIPYYYVYAYNGTNVSDAKATDNYNTYGVLYNWTAAIASCPAGWHLPSDAEWTKLTDNLGGEDIAGGKLKETGTTNWLSPNTGATNKANFTALPGGYRYNGGFEYIGYYGYWWSATDVNTNYAWYRLLYFDLSNSYRYYMNKQSAYSIRCVKD